MKIAIMQLDILRRNNVTVYGQGCQVMLFGHGFGCDQTMWRLVTPAFAEQYRIVLFDYVGSGKSYFQSYDRDRYSDLHGYVQDVLDICETLDLKNIIYVGHSVSCMIGLLASIREPNYFERLILVAPSPCYLNEANYIGGFERQEIENLFAFMEKNYRDWAHSIASLVMQNPEKPELSSELENSLCSTNPDIANRFAKATFFSDNRQDLAKVTVPSLILQCSEDIIAPLEVGNYLEKHLPNTKLHRLKATGHCPHLSHPQETIAAIKEYLISG